jgi:peptidoglycan hydrolase-like protein with peptidoglycan-binding domain
VPVLAAGGVLALVVGVGAMSGGDDSSADSGPSTIASTGAAVTQSYDDAVGTAPTLSPIQKSVLDRTLADGKSGDDVTRAQERLKQLGFDPGPVDGAFGTMTKQAVWAFEKLVLKVPRAQATGKITPDMWSLMQDPIQIAPRRPTSQRPPDSGDHVEIYLPEQVMVIFHGDVPALITHVSSGQQNPDGSPFEYHEDITVDSDTQGNLLPEPVVKSIIGWAYTPPGVFQAGREVVGTRNGPLGSMWDPTYINQGIAIHGANNVPLEPASHGCIRINRALGPIVQGLIDKGDFVYIWDGKQEPEEVSDYDRLMRWDIVDPSKTTTTTSTTVPPSTTTATTVATTTPTTKPPTETTAAPTTVAPVTVATTPPPPTDPPATAPPNGGG